MYYRPAKAAPKVDAKWAEPVWRQLLFPAAKMIVAAQEACGADAAVLASSPRRRRGGWSAFLGQDFQDAGAHCEDEVAQARGGR